MEPRTPELFREKKRIFGMHTSPQRDLPPEKHRAKVMRDTLGMLALWHDATVTVTFDPIPPVPWPRTKAGVEEHHAAFYNATWHHVRTFKSQSGATRSYNALHEGYMYKNAADFRNAMATWAGGKRLRPTAGPVHTTHVVVTVPNASARSTSTPGTNAGGGWSDPYDDGYEPIPAKRNDTPWVLVAVVLAGCAAVLGAWLGSL